MSNTTTTHTVNTSIVDASLTVANTGGHAVTQVVGFLAGVVKVGAEAINAAPTDSALGRARDRSYSDAYTVGESQGASFVSRTFIKKDTSL